VKNATSKYRDAIKIDSKMFQCSECKKEHSILRASYQSIGVTKGSGGCKKIVVCPHCNWKDCIGIEGSLPRKNRAEVASPV
jgi:hypothetical protein